jgi:hypothetical protein
MPKVVLLVLPSLVTAPADALPFPVKGEADAGTAVGVADCVDMFRDGFCRQGATSDVVASRRCALLYVCEAVLARMLSHPVSMCAGLFIVVLIYVHRHVLMLL